jgi:hypothetical protein
MTIDGSQRAAFVAGTAAAPAITTSGDTDTGIFFPAANTLAFSTNGTEDARFDSAGNFLVGTTSGDIASGITTKISANTATGYAATNVNTGTAAYSAYQLGNNNGVNRSGIALFGSGWTSSGLYRQDGVYLYATGTGGITLVSESAQPIYFATSNTERMRLDASGNMGLGVTPSAWDATNGKAIQLPAGALWNYTTIQMNLGFNYFWDGANYKYRTTGAASSFDQSGGVFYWKQAGSGTAGNNLSFTETMRLDASGNLGLGTTSPGTRLDVVGAGGVLTGTARYVTRILQDNSSYRGVAFGYDTSGQIGIIYPETASAASTLAFWTYTGSAWGERARITSGGNLLVNTSSLTAAGIATTGTLQVSNEIISVGSSSGLFWVNRSGGVTSNSNWYGWYNGAGLNLLWNGGSNIASINGTTGAYTALSDVNKKKDFEISEIGLSVVMQLQPKLFRMLDDEPDIPKQLGFIAQEVKDVLPHAYVETTLLDAGNKESTYIGLQDRPIIAALVKAVQELNTRLEALENK